MAVGFPTKANWAAGDVLTAAQMDDLAGTLNTLSASTMATAGGKNYCINGNFDFFQRGSFASQTANGYNLDRWYCSLAGTVTITQQTTGVPAGSKYCARVAYNAASSVGNLYQALESGTVASVQGQTVTLSVKLRRNSTFAANLQINLYKNATADTLTGGSWTQIGVTTVANASLPTGTTASDWYTATLTAAIPNDGTANGLRISINESATGASGAYWEAAQVQLELGSTATPFARAGGTLEGESAVAQRYYQRINSTSPAGTFAFFGMGTAGSTTIAQIPIPLKVSLRIPAATLDFANLILSPDNASTIAVTGATIASSNQSVDVAQISMTVASGLTQFRPYLVLANNSNAAYIGLSAEL